MTTSLCSILELHKSFWKTWLEFLKDLLTIKKKKKVAGIKNNFTQNKSEKM